MTIVYFSRVSAEMGLGKCVNEFGFEPLLVVHVKTEKRRSSIESVLFKWSVANEEIGCPQVVLVVDGRRRHRQVIGLRC